jgi:DNA-binding CsgD family transcriptional regulator
MRHLAPAIHRLRGADHVAAIASAIISYLVPLARGVVVQVKHTAWISGDAFDVDAIRRSLRDGSGLDHVLPTHATGVWTVPLFGCGELAGIIRVASDQHDLFEMLLMLAMNASVRLAQIDDPVQAELTPRQYEVATLVGRGFTNVEIAELLAISPNAVKKHLSRVFAALQVSNRTELAALAGRWPLAPAEPPDPSIRVIEAPGHSGTSPRALKAA